MITTEYFDDYGPLKPGVRRKHQHNLTTPKFDIYVTLDELQPEKWRAEVRVAGELIIELEDQYPSRQAAGTAAEQALTERLVAVFRSR